MAARLIGICGTLSTGKTTLARALANRLNLAGKVTEYATEAATDYIVECGPPEDPFEEYTILREQMKREEDRRKLKGVEFVISDCPVFMTYAYTIDMVHRSVGWPTTKHKKLLMDFYKTVMDYAPAYDTVFFLPKKRKVVSNGIRQYDDDDALRIEKMILSVMTVCWLSYVTLGKDQSKWVDEAMHHFD